MKQHQIGTLFLALGLTLGLSAPALAAETDVAVKFPAVHSYSGFADVKDKAWYADTVKLCYEVGLMTGTNNGFEPNKGMTVAEAAVIAARMNELIAGGDGVIENPEGADHWYTGAVTYMHRLANQVQAQPVLDLLGSPEELASRQDFFDLLALAVPGEVLSPINSITTLPDTDDAGVLAFYNAGILTGVNDYGTFSPQKSLSRAEVAAMAARIARPALRERFTPQTVATPFAEDFDLCQYLLGVDGSAVYFTAGGLTITADAFLNNVIDISDQLYAACQEQGVEFHWDNISSGKDFLTIAFNNANVQSLYQVWSQSDDTIAASEALGTLKAKHIIVENKALADDLYAQLQADPTQFETLLEQYGTDGGMTDNPDGYVFGPGKMVAEFEAGTKALTPGEISAPIQSQFGWHIIQRLPLTEEDAWTAFVSQAVLSFGPAFPQGMDLKTAYFGWRKLVYAA